MITLVLGSEDFEDYDEFKRIITKEIPWELSWAYTNKCEHGVGKMIEQYCAEIWSPLCVHTGDPSIKCRKKRQRARNKYFMELCSHVVIIWRNEAKGGLRSVINKARQMFLPLVVYDLRRKKAVICISEARAEQLRAAHERELAAQLEADKAEYDISKMLIQEYGLSEHKTINILDHIRHLKKQFKSEATNGNNA